MTSKQKMKKTAGNAALLIFAFLGAALLASCLTDEQQFSGHGPLVLSPNVGKALAWHELLASGYLFVSADGEDFAMDYCGRGDCGNADLNILAILQQCRDKAKSDCKLLAMDGRVVWRGPLRIRAAGGSSHRLQPAD